MMELVERCAILNDRERAVLIGKLCGETQAEISKTLHNHCTPAMVSNIEYRARVKFSNWQARHIEPIAVLSFRLQRILRRWAEDTGVIVHSKDQLKGYVESEIIKISFRPGYGKKSHNELCAFLGVKLPDKVDGRKVRDKDEMRATYERTRTARERGYKLWQRREKRHEIISDRLYGLRKECQKPHFDLYTLSQHLDTRIESIYWNKICPVLD